MRLAELSPARRALLLGGLVLLLSLLLFLLAEGAVRLRALLKHGFAGVEESLTIDAATGLRIPIPGSRTGPIEVNTLGFRGPELTVPKPPGTIRLAFLGASTTYCAEVSSNEATWPALVAAGLTARFPGVRFDYVNGGVPGYSLDQSRRNLALRVAPLEPDVIVIYHATNDLTGNAFDQANAQGLIERPPYQDRFWLSDYSLLVRLVELNLTIRRRQQEQAPAAEQRKVVLDMPALVAPFRDDLSSLAREARAVAPLVAVATFATHYRRGQPPAVQLRAAETSLYYMPYMTVEALLDGFDAYNRTIAEVAAAEDLVLIDELERIPGDRVHFVDSVHFTDAGSQAMAGRVLDALLSSPELAALIAATGTAGGAGQLSTAPQ